MVTNETSEFHKKHGRHVGFKNIVPWKEENKNVNDVEWMISKHIGSPQSIQIIDVENLNEEKTSEEVLEWKNEEISIDYLKEKWNRENYYCEQHVFICSGYWYMINDYEPQSIHEYKEWDDWPKYNDVIQSELK